MDLGLKGKTVIVTGGSSNISYGITLGFAKEGSNVVVVARDEAQGQKVVEKATPLGGKTIFVKCDITNNDEVVAMVKKTNDTFGPVDVLVNNAGWEPLQPKLFWQQPKEEWDRLVAINFWGPIFCIRAVIEQMIARNAGSIVSVGSDTGRVGESQHAIYGACKGGTMSLTKTLAKEVGRYNIRVNLVSPGLTLPGNPPGIYQKGADEVGGHSMWAQPIFTEDQIKMLSKNVYPLRKIASPEEVANMVIFLASEKASDITGQIISVSGGYTMIG